MNSKVLISVLSIGILFVCSLYYIKISNFKDQKLLFYKNEIYLKEKNSYLKQCLTYGNSFDSSILNNLTNQENTIIYYAGNSCSACVEDFLKKYMKEKSILDEVIVISDDIKKDELVINFNDAYSTKVKHKIDKKKYFNTVLNDIIFIKIDKTGIPSLLTYSYEPRQKEFFLEFAPKPYGKN